MRTLSLKEIQKYSLDILLDVHAFCESNRIQYSLAYGTLIGAVRHKGFIPWDDDIDIVMTRDNFERFVKTYESSDDLLLVSPYDKKSYIAFARVCDMKNTVIETRTPWSEYTTGVWIDIFPVDSIDDDINRHKIRYKCLNRKWKRFAIPRGAKARFDTSWGFYGNLIILLKKIISFNGSNLRKSVERFINEIKDDSYNNSEHCGELACCGDWFEYYEKKDFERYILLEFEGYKLKVIESFDKILKLQYGDYMCLPPKERQAPKQFNYIHFFLKE